MALLSRGNWGIEIYPDKSYSQDSNPHKSYSKAYILKHCARWLPLFQERKHC